MTLDQAVADPPVAERAEAWLAAFADAIAADDRRRFEDLFDEDSYWRDIVALTWDTRQFWGREALQDEFAKHAADAGMADLRLDPDRSPPHTNDFLGLAVVEFFFAFDLAVGTGKGFLRLVVDHDAEFGMRAQLLSTALVALDCAPEPTERHPHLGFDPQCPGQTWGEWVASKSDFTDRDPDVLIVGGSHSGLSVGARFERKGVSYLIVERNAQPGDMWRGRYESLALHTHTRMNDLPYLTLPAHWGSFTPKDQWADWLDCYARLMNLNVWTSTELVGATFDADRREWAVQLRLADGTERTMRPKHVVLAIGGVGGSPKTPELPGLADFAGDVLHSSKYRTGAAYAGQRVLVVGSSTTAHDICLDLFHKGATPTMAQRGPTCVVNIAEVIKFSADYGVLAVEEADQLRSSMVLPLIIRRGQAGTRVTETTHAELHDGLRRAGQKLTIGHDETGWTLKLFRDTRGYYLNVGCSEAIVDGRVAVLDYDRVDHFVAGGVRLDDGTVLEFDAVVLATGFHDLAVDIEALFGPEVGAKFERCIGVADDGEYRTMSRPTAQPHLWLINGGIIDARKSSDVLALQVIAQLHGLVPTLVRQPDGTVAPL